MEEARQGIFYRQLKEGLDPNKISIFNVENFRYIECELTPKSADDYFIEEMDLNASLYKGLNLYAPICNFLKITFDDYNKRHGYIKEFADQWLLHTRLLAKETKAMEEINIWCDVMEQKVKQATLKLDNPQPEAATAADEAADNEQQEHPEQPVPEFYKHIPNGQPKEAITKALHYVVSHPTAHHFRWQA